MKLRPDLGKVRLGWAYEISPAVKPSTEPSTSSTLSVKKRSWTSTASLFFYEARLRHRYEIERPLKSAILAPQLENAKPVDRPYRSIRFNVAGESDSAVLEVLPIELNDVLASVREGDFIGGLNRSAELRDFISAL
jgi:hypothetical protein